MPVNMKPICIFDFETLGLDYRKHDVVQIGALMVDPRGLDVLPGGEFKSMLRPERPENAEQGALRVTGFKLEELMEAPLAKVVWQDFFHWVGSFNPKGGKFTRPIPCGYNIIKFDFKFLDEQLKRYGLWDDGQDEGKLFGFPIIDLMHIMWAWFESSSDPAKLNMDCLRGFFGIDEVGHDALVDCYTVQKLLKRFLNFKRTIVNGNKVKFKGAFRELSNA